MKRIFQSAVFAAVFCAFISCSTERNSVATTEDLKPTEMVSFDNALKAIMKPENRSTPEEQAKWGAQLNDRALDILFNASLQLTGKKDRGTENFTRVDKEKVIVQATNLYFSKLNTIKANQKAEN